MAVDLRFYARHEPLNLKSIADQIGIDPGNVPDRRVAGVSSFQEAGETDLCFLDDPSALAGATRAMAGICLVSPAVASLLDPSRAHLVTEHPRAAFFSVARQLFSPLSAHEDGKPATVHETARIAPGAVLSSGVVVGPNTEIGAGTYIGPGVQIGADCQIGDNASIGFALIGNGVRLQPGVRIGQAGFGLMPTPTGAVDTPHFGRVILQDDVSIGANTCVDRGLLSDTVIGEGSKIDNMSHIGHNVVIGRHVVMAAYAGISGSVTVGDGVRMGGRVGIIDHIRIGAGASLAVGALVCKHVGPGEAWGGNPARPIRQWQRETIWLKRKASDKGDKT